MPLGRPSPSPVRPLSLAAGLVLCLALSSWLNRRLEEPVVTGLVGTIHEPTLPDVAAPYSDLEAQLAHAERLRHCNDPASAQEHFLAALQRLQAPDAPPHLRARALDGLGSVSRDLGDLYHGLSLHLESRKIFRQQRLWASEAEALHHIGIAYIALGDDRRAKDYLTSAFERHTNDWRRATTIVELATLNDLNGDCTTAIQQLRQAFALRMVGCDQSDADKRFGKSLILDRLASAAMNCQQLETALTAYRSSLTILEELGHRPGTCPEPRSLRREHAIAVANQGVLYTRQGRYTEAAATLRAALRELPEELFPHDRAIFEFRLAQALRPAGEVAAAHRSLQTSLRLSEGLRRTTATTVLRTSFASRHHVFRQELIDLQLQRLEELVGETTSDATTAFEIGAETLLVASQGRALNLLRRLIPTGQPSVESLPGGARQRARLEQQLRALEHRRLDLLRPLRSSPTEGSDTFAALATLEAQQRQLIFQLQSLQEPTPQALAERHAEAAEPHPSAEDLGALQSLLDDDTLLLAYWLGDRRSALWQVDRHSLRTHLLPPRDAVETLVQTVVEAMANSDQLRNRAQEQWIEQQQERLSAMLLGPVAEQLGKRRLAIIADGRLLQLPFAALRHPRSARPLVTEHEIIHLPSLPVLRALRQRRERQPRPPFPSATVFAAAAYRPPKGVATLQASPSDSPGGTSPPPLHHSLQEAASIQRRLPAAAVRSFVGGGARRQTLLDGDFPASSVLHLSLHGELDTERPEFSHLVFSLWDEAGAPVEGRLYVHEIDGLDLRCDLLVLSACNSARGTVFRDEGLVGMPFAALGAGAQRALVSLWFVDDEATAVLMEAFYGGLFDHGMSPAAALRHAQRQLAELEGGPWQSPYYWAGFVLYGDWRWPVSTSPSAP